MKKIAGNTLSVLAVFFVLFGSGFTYQQNNSKESEDVDIFQNDAVETSEVSCDLPLMNPRGFKKLKNISSTVVPALAPAVAPVPAVALAGKVVPGANKVIPQNTMLSAGGLSNQVAMKAGAAFFDKINTVTTAGDPRLEPHENPHRMAFVPASENRPPAPAVSIPIIDEREPMHYDLNEWEEDKFFSSNLYTDTSIYTTNVSGNKRMAPNEEGEYFEENVRYELYSSSKSGDTMSLLIDGTFTNDKSNFKHNFMLNQFTFDVANDRSRLVLGHAFPEMSQLSMTQNLLGIYGSHRFDSTGVSAFGGYYANEKEDLENPRYIGGARVEHSRDDSLKLGLNIVGTEDERDNAASDLDQPTLSNRLVSFDLNMKPTENIFLNAEVARSDTDFDKRDDTGGQEGTAYIFKGGYERENFRAEAGIEYADTEFATPLGESPRDDRSYYARFYYELNKYVNAKIGYKESRDNIANYARSTIIRKQNEFRITVKPSEYYKNLRLDFYYQPLHEYSKDSGFMDRNIDLLWLELNQKAGEMAYYMGLSKTIDRDDIDYLNDRDVERLDMNVNWERNEQHKVYGKLSIENIDYKRANNKEKTTWSGFGGSTKLNPNLALGLDYLRENVDMSGIKSIHDKLNLSLTREYNPSTRLILDLSGSRTDFDDDACDYDDYTAKLRLLKTF